VAGVITLKKVKVYRWIFAAVLGLSLFFSFLPYHDPLIGHYSFLVKMFISEITNPSRGPDWQLLDVILGYMIPVILTEISVFVMLSKTSLRKCIFCTVLNVLALILYVFYTPILNTQLFISIVPVFRGIGYIGNVLIATAGLVFPFIEFILYKDAVENKNLRARAIA